MSILGKFSGAVSLGIASLTAVSSSALADHDRNIRHVLLISVDGLHARDLSQFISAHSGSNLAKLAGHGIIYSNALTTAPSDSFPGLLAQVTGGTPKSVGVFYDVSFDRKLFAPGSNCQGPAGTQTVFDESIDNDSLSYTGGGTLGQPLTQINPAKLPMALRNGHCTPVYPHEFVKVNTIFEVIREQGGQTAWSDKHPAYDIVNGPSGKGVQDLFTPEVDSNDPVTGQDTTTGFHSVQRNDLLKVKAILNEITGLDSTGSKKVGVPTVFGMNFQAVSVGQKLAKGNTADPQDVGLIGGYADAAGVAPNNGLQLAFDFVDSQIGAFVTALQDQKLDKETLIIISAKHGQSPINVALRRAVDDSPYSNIPGFGGSITDDVGLVWLQPQSQIQDYSLAKAYLESHAKELGIVKLLDKDELTRLYQNPFADNRTPDFIAITVPGLIYTSGTKLAEHGGFASDDRNVGLLVSNPSISSKVINAQVETRQIAPTILQELSINPAWLQSVREEGTEVLQGLDRESNLLAEHR